MNLKYGPLMVAAALTCGVGLTTGAYAATQAKPKAGAPSSTIAALFSPDMINADRAYVERRTGPAKYVNDDERKYVVGGCNLTIVYKNNAVRNMAIDELSSRCTFDLAKFYQQQKPTNAAALTFGAFDKMFGAISYFPQCLGSCGNSTDPSMTAHYGGSHAEQFYEVQVSNSYPYRGEAAGKAFDRLLKALPEAGGDDYSADCDPRMEAVAGGMFATVPVKSIVIGYGLDTNPARCGR